MKSFRIYPHKLDIGIFGRASFEKNLIIQLAQLGNIGEMKIFFGKSKMNKQGTARVGATRMGQKIYRTELILIFEESIFWSKKGSKKT